jgi:hypothetical protein
MSAHCRLSSPALRPMSIDPEFRDLIVILDEQVRSMQIGMPPPEAKAIVGGW